MKSKFTNTLLDYDKNYKKINEVIRDNIIGHKKDFRTTIKEIKGLLYTKENIKKTKMKVNNKDINKLKRVLGNEVNNYKNQREFNKLQNEIEYIR